MFERFSGLILHLLLIIILSALFTFNPVSADTQISPEHPEDLSGIDNLSTSQDIDELSSRIDELEMELLKIEAMMDNDPFKNQDELKLKTFHSGQRTQQALNPEISVTGDAFARMLYDNGKEYGEYGRSGFFFRNLGLHFQAPLDPFSFTKIAIGVDQEGAHLGEAYAVWTSVIPGVSLTVGKFRQQLGIVNRWHIHSLDSFDFPLMLQRSFGPEGLNQVGLSFHMQLPTLWTDNMDVTAQITNAMNPNIFSGDFFSLPALLVRLGNYWDLSRNTYLELGITGLTGPNNQRGYTDETTSTFMDDPITVTQVAGFDLTVNYEPVNRAKYAGVTWRTEGLFIRKDESSDIIEWLGGYTSLQARISRRILLGSVFDLVQGFTPENHFSELDQWEWRLSPYLTFWQSPWVRLRLEYELHHPVTGEADHQVICQLTYAAGPHKHERY